MTASWSLGQGSSIVELLGMPEAQGRLFPVSVHAGTREGLRFHYLGTAPVKKLITNPHQQEEGQQLLPASLPHP